MRHPPPCRWLVAWCVLGCTGSEPDSREVYSELDEQIPTIAHLNWKAVDGEEARVQLLDGDGQWHTTAEWQRSSDGQHSFHIGTLPPGREVHLQPEVRTRDGHIETLETVSLQTQSLPIDFPEITVQTSDESLDGLVLTHFLSAEQSSIAIIDRAGQPVWYTVPESPDRILSVQLSPDGESLWFAQHPTNYIDVEGTVHHVALDGSFYTVHHVDRIHSGVSELPEGGFGYIYKADGEWQDGRLLWDEIWERDAHGVDRKIFSIRDHFEPEILCDHWALPDLEELPTGNYFDWTHANSLILSEDATAWYLLVRHFDALLKIDRSSGELIWTLGGPYSDFSAIDDGVFVSHPHLSQIEDGRIAFFDNGSHHAPPGSRVAIVRYDENDMTMQLEQEIRSPDGAYISELGDSIELPSERWMVSWSSLGLITEYGPDFESLWSLTLELGYYTGRISWLESL